MERERAGSLATSAHAQEKRKATKVFSSKLLVVLRVGNEFEGKAYKPMHEASTLSLPVKFSN